MLPREMTIADFDPELAEAIANETTRQEHHIELIASENYCSCLLYTSPSPRD